MEPSVSKKDLIIEAAVKVFASRGYYNSRISDIVKEANTAHGLFYHYYPSKEHILVTIFRNAFEAVLMEMERIDQQEPDAGEKLKSVIRYLFRVFHRDPDLYRVLIMDVPRLEKFYTPENQKLYNQLFAKIADFIVQGQQKGILTKDIPSVLGAHLLHGAVDAVIRLYAYNRDFQKDTKTFDQLVEQTTGLVFNGFKGK